MASVYHLFDDAVHTQEEIVIKYAQHDKSSKAMYFAVLKIQKLYRGYLVRRMVKNWHKAALLIQKCVRGWLVRYHLPDIMNESCDLSCIDLYNKSARKIQAMWKGFMVRKVICIHDIMKARADIIAVNEEIQKTLQQKASLHVSTLEPETMEQVIEVLFDRHHLLRTHQKEGIFSKRHSQKLTNLEKIIKSIKWTDYMTQLKKNYNEENQKEKPNDYMFKDKMLMKLEDLYRQRDISKDVREDITVDTSFQQEKPFIIKTKIDKQPYQRMFASYEKYTPPITDIVRAEDKEKNLSAKSFDLNVWKKCAKKPDVPDYHIDFWNEKCKIHNSPE